MRARGFYVVFDAAVLALLLVASALAWTAKALARALGPGSRP